MHRRVVALEYMLLGSGKGILRRLAFVLVLAFPFGRGGAGSLGQFNALAVSRNLAPQCNIAAILEQL